MNNLRIILVILAFVYWNSPVYLAAIPSWVNQFFYNGLPLLYLLIHRNGLTTLFKKAVKYKFFIYVLCFVLFVIIWAIATLGYNNSNDYSYFYKFFVLCRSIYIDIFLFMLSRGLLKNRGNLLAFSYFYGASTMFCVIFTIITLLFMDFRLTWQSLLVYEPNQERVMDIAMYITRFSVCGFAGFGQTIMCSISVVLSLFLIEKGYKFCILFFLFSLVGNLFYGRIGFILSSIAIIFWIIKNLNLKNIGIYFIYIIIILIATDIFFESIDDPLLNSWVSWLTNPIESFFYGIRYGQISFGDSGDILIERMYWMPNINTLILGDGHYMNSDSSYYMHTDAGYMRIILYFGIIGAFLVYMLYILLWLWGKQVNKYDKDIKYICEMLLLFFFIEEYKGDAYPIFFGLMAVLLVHGLWGENNRNA